MQLTYRGQTYTSANPTVEMTETGLKAIFRGLTYKLRRPQSAPHQPNFNLVYRGVPYSKGLDTAATPVAGGHLTPSFV